MIHLPRALPGLLLALTLAAPPCAAQSVRGELRDAEHARPLPGARLLLLSGAGVAVDSTVTDRTGRFRLAAPAAGSWAVHFQLDGWAAYTSEPLRLRAGTATDFEFRVPLVASAALHQISDIIRTESRLQHALPEMCGEPLRLWEAGLLVGVVRTRTNRAPVAGARVAVVSADGVIARATISSNDGIYILCNVPLGKAVSIAVEPPGGPAETTEVEIRAGMASWYDLPTGPRRR
jgi:hypothetical protein